MLNSSFTDKVVVVTGGSSGIGQQIARDLLRIGAFVTIVSDQRAKLDSAYAELKETFPAVEAIVCDIRNREQVSQMAQRVLERHQHIDILINNAGYAVYRPFEESTTEEVLDILDVNLAGAMRCAKAFLPSMIARRSGRIVNVSSIGGETIITPNAVYCAAKHGMVAWTRAIRYELSHFGVAVNVVCPGHTKTNFHDHPTFRRRDVYRRKGSRSMGVETVSSAVLDAIRKDRIVTYVPSWQGLVVWALNTFSFVMAPVWNVITKERIAQLYEQIESEKQVDLVR